MIKSKCIKDLLKEDNLDRAEDVYLSYYSDFSPENCCGSKTEHPIESIPAMAKGKDDPS
jgi:hypothetical protein